MARAYLALGIAAILAACAPRHTPLPSLTSLPPTDGFAACQEGLTGSGALYELLVPLHTREGCGFNEGVKVRATPSPLNQPAVLSCPTALAVTRFDLDIVQPAAQQHFGKRVVKIHHLGGYNCRGIVGTQKWSQHAYGNAIDVMGFDLADGTRITVSRDWRSNNARGAFLRDVASGACKVFRVVLTPSYDRSHRDHFHLDLGPERLCGI